VTRLFSYCIPIDDGAAPNPYWGFCTLAICKPAIRRVAKIGDWVVGTGSRNSPIGDISGHVVYAMRVTEKLTLAEYDAFARRLCRGKIPVLGHRDVRRRLGDAVYDFRTDPPLLRPSVHTEGNRERDLSGVYALISDHFFYFGDRPQKLPAKLRTLAAQQQGHRSHANDALVKPFVEWLYSLALEPNELYGTPQYKVFRDAEGLASCRKACSDSSGVCHEDAVRRPQKPRRRSQC
jgi:hypothetical protein